MLPATQDFTLFPDYLKTEYQQSVYGQLSLFSEATQ